MKVKMKTEEKLRAEGWLEGSYSGNKRGYGWYLGPSKDPAMVLTGYQSNLLGKEVLIIGSDLKRDNPTYKVCYEDHESTVPWQVLEMPWSAKQPKLSQPPYSAFKIKDKYREDVFAKRYDHGLWEFDCAFRDMNDEKILKVIRWASKLLGYKLVKRA